MTTTLQDTMARAVHREVLAHPENYPATVADTDLALQDYELDAITGLPSNAAAIERAGNDGLSVVYPAENELQIDIDNEQSYLFFKKQRAIVNRFVGIVSTEENPSKSGLPRRHITVRLKTSVTTLERLCLQACLGSDRVREVLGYVRYKNNEPNPSLFFEKTDAPQAPNS